MQRMGQAQQHPVAAAVLGQQAATAQAVDPGDAGDTGDDVRLYRLGQRGEPEDGQVGIVHPEETVADQIPYAARRARLAGPPPRARHRAQPAGLATGQDQLAEQQRVAAAPAAQPFRGEQLDRPAHGALENGPHRIQLERCQVDHLAIAVATEPFDGVADLLSRAHGQHHGQAAADDQLVHERGGAVVEQVRVVDYEGTVRGEAFARTQEQPQQAGAGIFRRITEVAGEVGRQRTERHRPGGAGRRGPAHVDAVAAQAVGGRPRQPGLADAGLAPHHQALPAAQLPHRAVEQVVAPQDRPLRHTAANDPEKNRTCVLPPIPRSI